MSNLGGYQIITSMAKKVGGPKQFVCILVGSGALVGSIAAIGYNALTKKISAVQREKRQEVEAATLYKVHTEGRSNEGLLFKVGDSFRVLETDGDAGLIEKIGDESNPYFVSLKFLCTISDYNVS